MKPPIPNSYWVEAGRMLAGEHPDGGSEPATRARIDALLAAGVRSFIDLTEPDELRPYRALLPAHVRYESFPLPDHSVPRSAQQMRELQQLLADLVDARAAVYVHCRAGIGRTGITVGCWLREQGESAPGALLELNRLWQQNARAVYWPSVPETEEQERFIRDWLPALSTDTDTLQRHRGCLIGLAVGDVVATAPAQAGAAAWSDETATTLCVAESLLACGGFDGRDQLQRFRHWAADPQAAGAGSEAVLRPVAREVLARSLWNRSAVLGSHDPAQQDPSALARCAAAALFAAGDVRAASRLGADVARVTHQAPLPVDGCRLFAAMVATALEGGTKEAVLSAAEQLDGAPRAELTAMAGLWQQPGGGRRSLPPVLAVLDRAVRSFARGRDFADGLARATGSAGANRDAVAAAYGALAGAHYGEAGIDPVLRARVAGIGYLVDLAGRLSQRRSAARAGLP